VTVKTTRFSEAVYKQVPAVQVRGPLQALPAQQGSLFPPQAVVHIPDTQARPLPHTVPLQQVWPSAPQPAG
jgi:hypothetical protein